jgi:hypothetical protein
LTGADRLVSARSESQPRRGQRRFRGRRGADPAAEVRRRIADDIESRWPELANTLNPTSIELLTTRSDEFVTAVEGHADYPKDRALMEDARPAEYEQKRRVKYERFLRTAEDVILAENLRRIGDPQKLKQFQSLIQAEANSLANSSR